MKKFILMVMLFVGIVTASAQKAYTLNLGNLWVSEYAGIASDTLGTVTATTFSYTYELNKPEGVFYNARVKVSDKTTGAAGVCTIVVQGKHFSTDTYSTLKTVSWTGIGSTDTIAPFSEISTKQYYRYYKVLVTNTSGKSKVDYVKFSFKSN
jgi:hypothetical protein